MQCAACAERAARRIAELEAQLRNALASLDAVTEHADAAVELCGVLAEKLEAVEPEFVDRLLTAEEQDLWDDVAPYGAADDADTGGGGGEETSDDAG